MLESIEGTGPQICLDHFQQASPGVNWQQKWSMPRRQSLPKKRIKEINNSIQLYQTDHKTLPSNINDLLINNYLDLSKSSLNNASWIYILDLPSKIIARPSKLNPIPKTKSIIYDFNSKEFIIDPSVDSLENAPFLKWFYRFEMKGIN